MKALALIQNQAERALVRTALKGFQSTLMPATPELALDQLGSSGQLDFILIDERFNSIAAAGPPKNRVLDFLSAYQGKHPDAQPLTVMLLHENSGINQIFQYTDSGVDQFIHRPLGAKDLHETLPTFAPLVEKPPSQLTAIKACLRFMKAGQPERAIPLLAQLRLVDSKNARVGVLYAQCLMLASSAEQRAKGLELLKTYDAQLPDCLPVKKLLRAHFRQTKDTARAMQYAAQVCNLDFSEEALREAVLIGQAHPDATLFAQWLQSFPLPAEGADAALRSAGVRLNVLKNLAQKVTASAELKTFLELLQKHKDLENKATDELKALAARVPGLKAESVGRAAYTDLLRHILAQDPGSPTHLESFCALRFAVEDYKEIFEYLCRAKDAKKFSAEYYVNSIRLAFAEKRMRDASEEIHAARRLLPADERWDAFAKSWSEWHVGQA